MKSSFFFFFEDERFRDFLSRRARHRIMVSDSLWCFSSIDFFHFVCDFVAFCVKMW